MNVIMKRAGGKDWGALGVLVLTPEGVILYILQLWVALWRWVRPDPISPEVIEASRKCQEAREAHRAEQAPVNMSGWTF